MDTCRFASSPLSTPIAFTRQPPAAVRELVVSRAGPSPPIPPAGHSGQWPPTAGKLPRRRECREFREQRVGLRSQRTLEKRVVLDVLSRDGGRPAGADVAGRRGRQSARHPPMPCLRLPLLTSRCAGPVRHVAVRRAGAGMPGRAARSCARQLHVRHAQGHLVGAVVARAEAARGDYAPAQRKQP